MIYKHTKHTVKEILESAGADIKAVGKMRVRVGGLPAHSLEQFIKIGNQPEVEVVVGVESFKVATSDSDASQAILTEHAKEVKEKAGKLATERAEALQKAKETPAK